MNGQVRRRVPLGLRLRLGHEPARFGHVLLLLRDQALPLRDQAPVLRDEALGLRVLGGRLLPWKRKAIRGNENPGAFNRQKSSAES